MMQKRKKYILGTSAVLILFLMIILRASVWGDFIQKKINEKIGTSGWSIQVGKSSGYLFGTMHLENVILNQENGPHVSIENSSINFAHLATLFGDITFDLLTLENMATELNQNWIKSGNDFDKTKSINLPFHIKSFFVSGRINSKLNDQSYAIDMKVGGEFKGGMHPTLNCDLLKVALVNNPNYVIDLQSIAVGYDGSSFYLNQVKGLIGDLPLNGELTYDDQKPLLTGNVRVSGIEINPELFSQLPLQTKLSSFEGTFNFESDFHYFSGELGLENDLGLDMTGKFKIGREKTAWILEKLELVGEKSQLNMSGIWEDKTRINSYMNLTNLDLSRWMTKQEPTNLSGLAIIDGSLTQKGSFDQIDLTLEVIESKLFKEGEISVQGQMTYQDSLLSTIDPVTVMIGDSYLTIDGEGNFKNKTINILADLEQADIELINQFLPGDFVSGRATGRLKVQGNINAPSASAELICQKIKVDNFLLNSLEFKSQVTVKDTLTTGYIDIKAGKGTWREKSFESGTVYATIQNNQVTIENCHFKSGKDFLQASGKFDGINKYLIDRLQIAYQNHYLVNAKPLSFSIKDSTFFVNPFEFHINDGRLEGVVTGGNQPEGHFKMSNFNAEILTQFLDDPRFQMSGIVFGEIWMQWISDAVDLDADLSLKNGTYMDEPFDEMTLSFLYKRGLLHMDDISMTRGEHMGIQANGVIPLGKKHIGRTPISLRSTFSNLSLGFVHKFIPDFFTLGGEVTGALDLNGFPDNTQFSYNMDIQDAVFDLINLGHVVGKGKYDGRRLFLESAKAIRHDGEISAYGSIPIDLNISSVNKGQFYYGDSLDFHTNAQISSLPFLSPYIVDLDSVRGDFNISLSLTGPSESIQRSGKIAIKDGMVYTLLISDPVKLVEGTAFMNHNQLVIQKMSAQLYHPNGKYQSTNTQNTTITGLMDFTQFFKPRYSIHATGKETSFKALYLDIAGQSNLDVTITGRDTVLIAGTVEVLDANIFYEFTSEEMGIALSDDVRTIMSYQISIPIRGSALFQNSQIDARVTGELSLSQIGHGEMDFGGEIFVEDGNVFSYKDNFEGLQGYVSFDNKGFSPIMDLNAFTMIDDERIALRITGGIDDLDIGLESFSGFSESDILELLTWGKRFEDQEITTTGFGNQTVSILGSLLENQLEKNLKDSEFGKMSIVDDIAISGAAGLLQGTNEDFEVTAKRQIGDKTFLNLSYKRSFSLANPNQSQIGVEYKLNRHFSVVGNIDDDGNLNLKYRYRYAY